MAGAVSCASICGVGLVQVEKGHRLGDVVWLFYTSQLHQTSLCLLVIPVLHHPWCAGPVCVLSSKGGMPTPSVFFGKETWPDVIHAVFAAAAFPECTCFISWPCCLLLERS